ncbi:MFS transporter [Nocardioides sp. CER19]|uniref:MFS transporter n=1 Tax=Nocardioides sp. CER19 TaxID=3038538 RepID=UPI002446D17C|nr:MFS transporter [Nocardioides sp. CER19]MDH2413482.1 MFS transporter [Nocardioides sp. CER19]
MTAQHDQDQHWHPDPGEQAEPGRSAGRSVAHGLGASARGVGRFGRYLFRQARRAADAQGAADSGLNRLLEMHAFNTAGDAAVAISLAGSLFFQVPSGDGHSSRESVALFLGLTMLPFAIVAPLIGPFLDRFAYGRRWAIGATMAVRAFLCWVLAGALPDQSPVMFPAALGVLVASKAYGVTRAAAVPRLLPRDFTLVKANGRVSMAGIVGVAVSAPLAGLASLAGPDWDLRYAFLLFVVATIAAIRLPSKVDSSAGEGRLSFRGEGDTAGGGLRMRMPATVSYALRANCAPKWLYGFLLMFMAFLLQEHPIEGWSSTVLLAIVAGSAGVGNFLGVVAASLVRRIRPAVAVSAVMVADALVALAAALLYSVPLLAVLGLVTGLGQALAKFSLDSSIQEHIPSSVQASAFARSDTTLQLAWVVGGFVGIALPLHAHLGLGVAGAVLSAWALYVLASRPRGVDAHRGMQTS